MREIGSHSLYMYKHERVEERSGALHVGTKYTRSRVCAELYCQLVSVKYHYPHTNLIAGDRQALVGFSQCCGSNGSTPTYT